MHALGVQSTYLTHALCLCGIIASNPRWKLFTAASMHNEREASPTMLDLRWPCKLLLLLGSGDRQHLLTVGCEFSKRMSRTTSGNRGSGTSAVNFLLFADPPCTTACALNVNGLGQRRLPGLRPADKFSAIHDWRPQQCQ